MSCDHCIGLLWDQEYGRLVTLQVLKEHMKDIESLNRYLSLTGASALPIYTLCEYADFRRATDLSRFSYCPYCGEKINWKEIARG